MSDVAVKSSKVSLILLDVVLFDEWLPVHHESSLLWMLKHDEVPPVGAEYDSSISVGTAAGRPFRLNFMHDDSSRSSPDRSMLSLLKVAY